jgi:hypothetical protein
MKKYFNLLLAVFLVILYLKGNTNPFRYHKADGVVISSPDGKKMSVIISAKGKPIEIVPIELIDAITLECSSKNL